MSEEIPSEKPPFYMDGYLRKNLDTARSVIKKDWDMVFVIDGYEGTGKSVLAMQMAMYCDPSLVLERICLTPKTFEKAVKHDAQKYQAVIYDEAYTGLSSRETMGRINKTLIRMLAECRQKNLFIFVVMPTFFDLDKYVALWRSRALIHVYTGSPFQRGFFCFFDVDKKKGLYVKGKKFYNYHMEKANFYGRFANQYVVDQEEYRQKKRDALKVKEEEAKITITDQDKRDAIFTTLAKAIQRRVINQATAVRIIDIPRTTFMRNIERVNGIESSDLWTNTRSFDIRPAVHI